MDVQVIFNYPKLMSSLCTLNSNWKFQLFFLKRFLEYLYINFLCEPQTTIMHFFNTFPEILCFGCCIVPTVRQGLEKWSYSHSRYSKSFSPEMTDWNFYIKATNKCFPLLKCPFSSEYLSLKTWHLTQGSILHENFERVISLIEIKTSFFSELNAIFPPLTSHLTFVTIQKGVR